MKKIFYMLCLAALAMPALQSCSNEEEDIFDTDAVDRQKEFGESALNVLTAAPNGWVMQYFLNNEAGIPSSVLLAKFEKQGVNGVVTFATQDKVTGNQYKVSEKSPFSIVSDNSVVLSFNSGNSIFHEFSRPDYPGYDKGKGMLGDYEFMVISADANEVKLKGKKRGTYTVLRPLAEGQDWEGYFKTLQAAKNNYFNVNPAPLYMKIGDKDFDLYRGASTIFGIVKAGGDSVYTEDWKFLLTNEGLRFAKPFSMSGSQSVQDFYYNADHTRLEAFDADGNVFAYIDGGNPYAFFTKVLSPQGMTQNSMYEWQVVRDDSMSPKFKAMYDGISNALSRYAGTLEMGFTYKSSTKETFYFRKTVKPMAQLNLTRDDANSVLTVEIGDGSDLVYNNLQTKLHVFDTFESLFNGASFKFEIVEGFSCALLKVTKVGDPDLYFNVQYVKA